MIFEFDGSIITTLDYLTVEALQAHTQQQNYIKALAGLVTGWDSSYQINEMNIGRIKADIYFAIYGALYEKHAQMLSGDPEVLKRIIRGILSGQRFRDDPLADMLENVYMPQTTILTDHHGNIIHLPYEGPYMKQPAHMIKFLTLYKNVVVELLHKKSK